MNVQKSKFCCFVVSNMLGDLASERVALFERINRWQSVISAGQTANNVGYRAPSGLYFLRWIAEFKYMICLENTREPEYITEKPFQAWFAGAVPIYNGRGKSMLNPKAFVDAGSAGGTIAELRRLELSPDLYETKRRAELSRQPISLSSFESQFRKLLLD